MGWINTNNNYLTINGVASNLCKNGIRIIEGGVTKDLSRHSPLENFLRETGYSRSLQLNVSGVQKLLTVIPLTPNEPGRHLLDYNIVETIDGITTGNIGTEIAVPIIRLLGSIQVNGLGISLTSLLSSTTSSPYNSFLPLRLGAGIVKFNDYGITTSSLMVWIYNKTGDNLTANPTFSIGTPTLPGVPCKLEVNHTWLPPITHNPIELLPLSTVIPPQLRDMVVVPGYEVPYPRSSTTLLDFKYRHLSSSFETVSFELSFRLLPNS